ncbi:hypothetical protein RRG08_015574 [Elysia crispata]|uniref:Uncharacterized protein n=1 Tax=Elysia crispata TaxID=231223 RepID=A0AAE1CZG6_9GAST|nr:hypothetical protein RRG08_015574 [Elysia crispata]
MLQREKIRPGAAQHQLIKTMLQREKIRPDTAQHQLIKTMLQREKIRPDAVQHQLIKTMLQREMIRPEAAQHHLLDKHHVIRSKDTTRHCSTPFDKNHVTEGEYDQTLLNII